MIDAVDTALSDVVIGPVDAPAVHTMTYNVRRGDGVSLLPRDRWSHRRPLVQRLLATERPALLGVQEALPDQAAAICAALGPSYRFVGHGRRPGPRGEACLLVFDADRFTLEGWEQLALSSTPHVAGSRTWGNIFPRVVVTARLRDAVTGAGLFVAVTHLDPFGRRSQKLSAAFVRELVEGAGAPSIVMGDLNAGPSSETQLTLLGPGVLDDAWAAASDRLSPEYGTYGGYRAPRVGGERIDLIAVTPDLAVERAAINARRVDGRWPSDHLPVQAVVRLR